MKIVFMGTPAAAVPTLERIIADGHDVVAVYTQPDRPAGRGNKLSAPPVKEKAIELGIPVFQPEKVRTQEALEVFRSHQADVAVVVAYGRILPAGFLSAYPKGAVNVHFSLLPKLRGAAPVNWAIANGDRTTGITTMKMDEGLDTGDILLQSETQIPPSETAIELMERLAELGADLLAETLVRFDEISPVVQAHELATHAPILKRSDGEIDWSLPAEQIANRVRGFQPFPGSFTSFRGEKLTIWAAEPSSNASSFAPGEIGEIEKGAIIVGCGGETALRITELQQQGRKRLSARDLLNGVHIEKGERFSQTQ
ncbi:MAG TPA: methionyl-tRNA formyltransferase [Pyrinomonadaceae bacterium]|nr:methionyl-tRNA formyltransferase [Pyrinomonadaceae bacterium]